jgi:hypothetical protein
LSVWSVLFRCFQLSACLPSAGTGTAISRCNAVDTSVVRVGKKKKGPDGPSAGRCPRLCNGKEKGLFQETRDPHRASGCRDDAVVPSASFTSAAQRRDFKKIGLNMQEAQEQELAHYRALKRKAQESSTSAPSRKRCALIKTLLNDNEDEGLLKVLVTPQAIMMAKDAKRRKTQDATSAPDAPT